MNIEIEIQKMTTTYDGNKNNVELVRKNPPVTRIHLMTEEDKRKNPAQNIVHQNNRFRLGT